MIFFEDVNSFSERRMDDQDSNFKLLCVWKMEEDGGYELEIGNIKL